jgi:hypothetical protein
MGGTLFGQQHVGVKEGISPMYMQVPGADPGALVPFSPSSYDKINTLDINRVSSFMMMWFTKKAAQVVNDSITRVGSRGQWV